VLASYRLDLGFAGSMSLFTEVLLTFPVRRLIDTSNATGRMVAGVLVSLAELELELGRERRTAAREARRARGQHIGRPKALDKSKASCSRRTCRPVVMRAPRLAAVCRVVRPPSPSASANNGANRDGSITLGRLNGLMTPNS
jgi:hypothetical protein